MNSALLGAILASVTSGCREGVKAREDIRLSMLVRFYAAYMHMHHDQPPGDAAEFRRYIDEVGEDALKRGTATTIEELFTSPRDNLPYVIVYGKQAMPLLERDVVAYEQIGKDGRRFVGFRLGYVEELDGAAFSKLIPAK